MELDGNTALELSMPRPARELSRRGASRECSQRIVTSPGDGLLREKALRSRAAAFAVGRRIKLHGSRVAADASEDSFCVRATA